jgi:hypothetical protein
MSEAVVDDIVAVLPPLLQSLDSLEFIAIVLRLSPVRALPLPLSGRQRLPDRTGPLSKRRIHGIFR